MIRTSFRDGTVEACSSFLDYLRSQIVQFLMKNVLNKSLLIILNLADYSKQYKMVEIVLEKLFKVTNVPIYKCCFCHKFLSEGSSIRQITWLLNKFIIMHRSDQILFCFKLHAPSQGTVLLGLEGWPSYKTWYPNEAVCRACTYIF